ncbi:MAG: hypothetical protein IKF39_04245 [Oscillospiraceae bacterium]|nr:hypothetical protein [Oscillospiraceae bacterium]
MAIKTEIIGSFTRTYSDAGVYIQGGFPPTLYVSATDPTEFGRTYTETDIPIEDGEATAEDYEEALEKLGVSA